MKRSQSLFFGVALVAVLFLSTYLQQHHQGPVEGSLDSASLVTPESRDGVHRLLASLEEDLAQHRITPNNCSTKLPEFFNRAMDLKVEDFNGDHMQANGHALFQRTFAAHLQLRGLMSEWENNQGPLSNPNNPNEQACVWAFRRAFRGLRVLADYVAEAAEVFPYDRRMQTVPGKSKPVEKVTPAFAGGENYLIWNPKFGREGQEYVPKSGDVIVSRGMASTSAAIARITDEDTNFSHLSMVYVDPLNGKVQTIEAHIEIGSNVFDWSTYVGDKKARTVVFRYRDPVIADKAARWVRDYVADYKKRYGHSVCYDFGMNMVNHDCIFCSEIVEMGYEKLGIHVPLFSSTMLPKNRQFLESFGVTESQTFAPADVELDSRFEMVAEWRDLNRLHTSHLMDATLTAMFKWMDNEGYAINPSAGNRAKSTLGYVLRRIPLVEHTVDKLFPTNMSAHAIATELALNDVVNAMVEYLNDSEKALSRSPKRLTPAEMLDALERFRIEHGSGAGASSIPKKYDYSKIFHR